MNYSLFDRARRDVSPVELDLIEGYAQGRISRRAFVTRGSVLGLSMGVMGAVIAACGSDKPSTSTAAGTTMAPDTTMAGGDTTMAPETTAAAGAIKQGGTLRIATQKPGGPLDPVAMDNLGSYTPVVTSFEYLCGKGEGAALAPMLATEWKPNTDGSEWTFTLRKGVKWHDGSPFTSADVVATLDRLAGSNLKSYIDAGSATAKDDLTVVVKLKSPDGQFPYQVSLWNPQSVITPKDYELGTTLDKRPAGTGPFKLDKYDVATGATFVRNDDWWDGKPFLDKVQFIFSDDIAAQVNGLQAGEADAALQFSLASGEALLNDPNFTISSIRGTGHRQLWMNVRDSTSPFTDKKTRQAIALGIDRQALIDTLLKGRGDMANDHPIAPAYEFFDSSVPQRKRDVDKAKALLAETKALDGKKLTMSVPKLQEIPQLAELLQSQLKDIGLDITLDVISTDTFYDSWCKVYDSKTEPAGCDGGTDFGIVDYGSRGTPDVYLVKAYATGEWNSAHYNSPDFNGAVKEYQAALDLDGRKKAITKVETIANEDVPYAIPYFYNALTAYKKNVSGIVASGLGHYYCGHAGFTS